MNCRAKFLFVGNGPYTNRGCEAIVRGTLEILNGAYEGGVCVANGVFARPSVVRQQNLEEPIDGVDSFSIYEDASLLGRVANKIIQSTTGEVLSAKAAMYAHLPGAIAVLAVGGDNFSLDYGLPYRFLGWNALARDFGLPVVIWGASVGPFSGVPRFERIFATHARSIARIYVRESETYRYLAGLGLEEKITLVADPAFAMKPRPPDGDCKIAEGAVGINLSPLLGRYIEAGGQKGWHELAVKLVVAIAQSIGRPVVLIPHVTASSEEKACDPGWMFKDDHVFLSSVAADARVRTHSVSVLPNSLTARELKFVISRLWAFVGARTHATIAAFSSRVPCLSLAYSVKAKGLNLDIFDTTDFCIQPRDLSVDRVLAGLRDLEASRSDIIRRYDSVLPGILRRAYSAGLSLRSDVLGS